MHHENILRTDIACVDYAMHEEDDIKIIYLTWWNCIPMFGLCALYLRIIRENFALVGIQFENNVVTFKIKYCEEHYSSPESFIYSFFEALYLRNGWFLWKPMEGDLQ